MTASAERRPEQSPSARPYSGFDSQPIAGEWRHGRGGGVNRDHDPFTGAVLVEIPQADRADMGAAYAFAAKAQPAWASRLPARGSGVRQVVGGEPRGLVLPPHVFADVTNDMELAREELFGPVAPVIRARDEEDALRIANDTGFGLSSSVFTADLERGARFAQRLETGMAHVNDQSVNDLPNNPFGGEKNSGIGRFGGGWAVEAFTTDQWLTVQHVPRKFPHDARAIQGPWGGG